MLKRSTSATASEKSEVCDSAKHSVSLQQRQGLSAHYLALIRRAPFPTLDAIGPFDIHHYNFLMRGLHGSDAP